MKNLNLISLYQLSLYLLRAITCIALLISFQSCKDPDIVTGPTVSQQAENDPHLQTLTNFLAGYTGVPIDKVNYVKEEKMFIIDGDITVTRSSAEGYLNADKAGRVNQRQGLWLLNDDVVKDIKVYVNPAIDEAWRIPFQMAIQDWNDMPDTKVKFQQVYHMSSPNPDIIVNPRLEAPKPDGSPNWVARQSLPKADGTIGGGMEVNIFYNADSKMPESKKQFAIAHELGHAIGLSHTDIPSQGHFDYQVCDTPVFDNKSVMNSTVQNWSGFSYYDRTAAKVLYPNHTWKYLPSAATDVAASSGPNQSLWMVGKSAANGGYAIYKFDYAANKFNQVSGGALRIAVGPDGTPWVVNNLGQIFYKRGNSDWKQLPGNALDIAVGSNGEIYIISTVPAPGGFAIKYWKDNQWQQMPGLGAVRITVSSTGRAWAIDNANRILKSNGSSMVDTGGLGRDIAAGRSGSMYVIGQTPVPGGYSVKKNENDCWVQLSGGGVAITAHGGGMGPVIINNLGMVLEY